MSRFALLLISALMLAAAALFAPHASARSLITPTDVSRGLAILGSTRDPFAELQADGPSGVHMTWSDLDGNYHTRDSTNNGETFGEARDTTDYWQHFYASDAEGRSTTAVVGPNIYQAWSIFNGGGTFFRHSSDGGINWSEPLTLSTVSHFVIPTVVAYGDRVFVIWEEGSDAFAATSLNDGATFSPKTDLGPDFGGASITPLANGGTTVVFSGSDGFNTIKTFPTGDFSEAPIVVKMPNGGSGQFANTNLHLTTAGSVIFDWTWAANSKPDTIRTTNFTYSNDNGVTWSEPIILEKAPRYSVPVFTSGPGVWLFTWTHEDLNDFTVEARAFYDSGAEASDLLRLGPGGQGVSGSAAVGDTGYIAWVNPATDTSPPQLLLTTVPRTSAPSTVSIPISAFVSQPRVVASGTEAAASIYLSWFGLAPGTQEQHLFFSRAIITGSSDCSGLVGLPDVLTALRVSAGLPAAPCSSADDVNCDGAITPADALLLADNVAGLP